MESTQTKGRALQCKRGQFNLRDPAPRPRPRGRGPACLGWVKGSGVGAGLGGVPSTRAGVDGAPTKGSISRPRQQPGWLSPRGIQPRPKGAGTQRFLTPRVLWTEQPAKGPLYPERSRMDHLPPAPSHAPTSPSFDVPSCPRTLWGK